MGTTCTLNKETGLFSSAAADRPRLVRGKNRPNRVYMTTSNSYTTLASVFHTVYQGPYEPHWQPHSFLYQGPLELINGSWT
ncbi:hypothetical protein TNCV_278411 [Trichonephila clavipes]|nr:hypothetical protein TNCV_278411 [Trichonephila clavipes]